VLNQHRSARGLEFVAAAETPCDEGGEVLPIERTPAP
jgi:hypothetical protein